MRSVKEAIAAAREGDLSAVAGLCTLIEQIGEERPDVLDLNEAELEDDVISGDVFAYVADEQEMAFMRAATSVGIRSKKINADELWLDLGDGFTLTVTGTYGEPS